MGDELICEKLLKSFVFVCCMLICRQMQIKEVQQTRKKIRLLVAFPVADVELVSITLHCVSFLKKCFKSCFAKIEILR